MKGSADHGVAARRARVILVGYEEHENLGLRTIQAVLEARGVSVALLPFTPGSHSPVVATVLEARPELIGFSILFQYSLDDFSALAAALREAGVTCHFTAGGHYPSLRPEETLRAVPALDSVVRFEGERTLPELLENLAHRRSWHRIRGLAFRRRGGVVTTLPREVVTDLDGLPRPLRSPPRLLAGVPMAPMLASRGCLHRCTFCSIRQFYRQAGGPSRRSRSPASVVAEMADLHRDAGVRVFVFEDDDFAARTPSQRRWLGAFLEEMRARGLVGRVLWMAACRVDEVDAGLIARCMEAGLAVLFLGVESGNAAGLRALGKGVTVGQNLRAIRTVKQAGLYFDMGFMLMDPESTVATVRANLAFLRQAAGDGATIVPLAKTVPYAGTVIEERLRAEGRLMGSPSRPNYSFRDPRLDLFAAFAFDTFQGHALRAGSLTDDLWLARVAWLVRRALRPSRALARYGLGIAGLTARANAVLLDALEEALTFVEDRSERDVLRDWHLLGARGHLARLEMEGIRAELGGLGSRRA